MIPTTKTDHSRFREKAYFLVRSQVCFLFYGHTHSKSTRKEMYIHIFERAKWKFKVFTDSLLTAPPQPPRSNTMISRGYTECMITYHLSGVGLLVISVAKMVSQRKTATPSDLLLILQKQAQGTQTHCVARVIKFEKHAHLPFFPPVMKKPMAALIKLLSGK